MPSTGPLRQPWLPIRGDREEAGFVSQACTSSPHSAPPPSHCAVILAPWCGRMFTAGWSEPRLLTPQHSPRALSVTRRLGRLLCPGFSLLISVLFSQALLPPPPWQVAHHGWPTVGLWFFFFFSFSSGKVRVGASRENRSCGLPHHPEAPSNFLAAGLEARKELPSHPIWKTSLWPANWTNLIQKTQRE